jgi:hypothetical protein
MNILDRVELILNEKQKDVAMNVALTDTEIDALLDLLTNNPEKVREYPVLADKLRQAMDHRETVFA